MKNGTVSTEWLDRAVGEILRLKFELGLFENPYQSSPERAQSDILRPEYRKLAKEAADKSIVLLKNEGVLPLKRGVRIGVWGELASSRTDMLGAWSVGADGELCVSLVDAPAAQKVDFVLLQDNDLSAAENCDVIIAAVGETKELSGEAASRAIIELPVDCVLRKPCFRYTEPIIAMSMIPVVLSCPARKVPITPLRFFTLPVFVV